PVERVAGAEIRGDRDAVAAAGVRSRERPAAQPSVGRHSKRDHLLDLRRALPVLELATVEVARNPVESLLDVNPAEEDVARRLHHPLTDDDSLGVILVHAPADVLLEHRFLGLLQLKEQRIAAVTTEEQRDPRPRADAADADDLPREVLEPELLEQFAPVVIERLAIDPDQGA